MACQTAPSLIALRLSLLPACPSPDQVCVHPSCSPRQAWKFPVLSRGHLLGGAPPCERLSSLYSTGPRSSSGYAVPNHQRLIDPIRPTRGHIATSPPRLICDAFAVRERLGDPRVVPGFRCPFRPDMPSSTTPGISTSHKFQSRDVDLGLRRLLNGSALPNFPQLRFMRDTLCRGFLVHSFATACQVARRPVRI